MKALTKNGFVFLENTKITFATQAESKAILGTSDAFTKAFSTVDIAARFQDATKIKEQDYLDFAVDQAEDWTKSEIKALYAIIQSAEKKIDHLGLNLSLPTEIKLIKSTMQEEGGAAGYTRGHSIILKGKANEDLFVHELFHVLTRNSPVLRDQLYTTIGFQKCNRIEFPAALNALKITNPDAPFIEHYLRVVIDEEEKDIAFIIKANHPYNGGPFRTYIKKKLLILEGPASHKKVKLSNGSAMLLAYEAIPNLRSFIGDNTGYDIHPEEILADHFKLLVSGQEVNTPSFLTDMKAILQA